MSAVRRLRETVAAAAERTLPGRGADGAGLSDRSGSKPGGALAPRPAAIPTGELERRRDEAARRFAEAHWDLGGLTYEMAVRDHFRLDVLQRQAAQVQELDAELSQLERLVRLEESGAAGTCPECHHPYGRGAAFCSTCGTQLVDTVVAP